MGERRTRREEGKKREKGLDGIGEVGRKRELRREE